jgi:hypothetical protein
MKILSLITSLFILFSCQTKTTQKTENTDSVATTTTPVITQIDEALTFGFSNEKGNRILAFEENTNPKWFTQVIDNQGHTTKISFIKTQKGIEGGVNQTSFNFDNCTGQLFEISSDKKFNTDYTSVLFNEEFSKNHQSIFVKTLEKPQVIDRKIKNAIATERKRAVKNAWKIADFGENQSAYIVVFSPKKDSVLASLVIGNKQFIYRDYPAKYDEGSTWRVDDGGEFPNDAIRILAVFRNPKGELEIITEWAGAEGANIEYIKANKNIFEIIKEASRYWGAG